MRWRLGDILACPVCGYSPLQIHELEVTDNPPGEHAFIHPCVHFCALLDRAVSESMDQQEYSCSECHRIEIEEGFLICPQCKRWFSILDGIPHLIRDELRIVEREIDLLQRNKIAFPDEILEGGNPVHLGGSRAALTEQDTKMLEEGVFWGEFFKAYVARGDTSILDIRSRGTHPTFLNYGVGECDDMEKYRPWGPWPTHLGKMLFTPLSESRGKRGLDYGCGGGQFGLEAAYEGIDMTGFDISPGALEIARSYAKSKGLDNQYIYAETNNLPFRRQVFSLLMSKDSLHHLPQPEEAIHKVKPTLIPDALVIIIEHCGNSGVTRTVYDFFARRLVPKIQRRYRPVEIPEVLLRGSPNEDLGMQVIEKTLKQHFYISKEHREWMLYLRLEQLIHFAFGKRRWLTNITGYGIYLFERLCLNVFKPDHVAIIARYRM